ncbi:copper resistance protein B precursor [mine drainage metagenome]|uniref:Copper resistance protein B n=1 Tax=mine drainage metagenome TaxID=410659 RepID=A0A1J5QLC1_9ZZZZ
MNTMHTKLLSIAIAAMLASPAWSQDATVQSSGNRQHHTDAATAPQGTTQADATMSDMTMPGMMGESNPNQPQHESGNGMQGMTGSMGGMGDTGAPVPQHTMQSTHAPGPVSLGARDPNAYSDGYTLTSGPYALAGLQPPRLADQENFGSVLVDRLERAYTRDGNSTAYDVQAWFGRDYNRAVLKAEGDIARGRLQDARTEVLWGHAVAAFWDMQLGLRQDGGVGPDRSWLAFGVQGLAPYWFDVEATGYLGDQGRSAIRLATSYDILLTQKLILQPRLETNLYGKSDPARMVGSGLSDATAGLRLRYEITRQFAPYVGVEWAGKFGQTAGFAHAADEKAKQTRLLAGLRFWF